MTPTDKNNQNCVEEKSYQNNINKDDFSNIQSQNQQSIHKNNDSYIDFPGDIKHQSHLSSQQKLQQFSILQTNTMQSNRSLIDSESNQQSFNNQIAPQPIQTYKAVNNTIDEIIIASKNTIVLQHKEIDLTSKLSKKNSLRRNLPSQSRDSQLNSKTHLQNHQDSSHSFRGQQIPLQDEKSDMNEDESRDQVHSIKGSDFGENQEDTNPSRLYCNNHQRQRSHKSDQNLNKFMYNYQENMSTQNVFQSQNTSVNLLLDHSQHNIKNQYQDTLTRQSINGMAAHKARHRSRSFFEESPAKKHWMKISNVLKGINLMRKNIVRTIQHPDELVENINKSPRRRKTLNSLQSLNLTKNVLDEMRLQDKFFELISTGGEHSLQKILKELEDDPKKHIYDLKDPNHLINKYNRVSKTPLYVACQHGNLDVVQLLLEQQADPFILSKAGHKEWESLLQVTARWSHIKVFEYLIQNVKWEKKEILLLLKLQNINPAIKEMAKRYSRYNFGFFFNCCHCI
eukprot:403371776